VENSINTNRVENCVNLSQFIPQQGNGNNKTSIKRKTIIRLRNFSQKFFLPLKKTKLNVVKMRIAQKSAIKHIEENLLLVCIMRENQIKLSKNKSNQKESTSTFSYGNSLESLRKLIFRIIFSLLCIFIFCV
jgi:hypothetical protein